MKVERIEAENAFIIAARGHIAVFSRSRFEAIQERGVVLIQSAGDAGYVDEMRYLTESELTVHGLLGDDGPPVQRAVTEGLRQYQPGNEAVVLFLYPDNGTVYLLDIQQDLLFEE
jgi:hypothetical protein